jgi:PAS domain S-box-containing protein
MAPTSDIQPSGIADFMLNQMTAMIGYWDRKLHNRFANQAYATWFGFDPEEIRGKHIREILGEARYRLNRPCIEGVLAGARQEFERAILSPDGQQLRYALVEYIPDMQDGEVRGFTVLLSDITSVKKAEEQRRLDEGKLRDMTLKMEVEHLKSEFLAHAAHELRTPMASIYGFAELMIQQNLPEDTIVDISQTIHRNCETMISIINDLLDLARIDERRGMDFVFAPLDVAEIIREIVADFSVPAGRSGPGIKIEAGVSAVRADREKLRQILFNLLSNAYKYSPPGTTVEISVIGASRPHVATGHLPGTSFTIVDHGIGMTPEHVGRIGERFFRADRSGKVQGNGLGLALVKEIVSLHKGEMDVTSEPDIGTTITVWLPAS